MTFAKNDPCMARGERLHRAALVAFAVGYSVAIKRDGMVGSIDRHQVDQFARLGGLGRTIDILGAAKKIAASNPTSGFPFAKNDRVEVLAVWRLDGQRSPALLIQTGERHPDFEGFFAKVGREGFGGDPCVHSIQNESPATDHRSAFGMTVHGTDGIAQIPIESPLSQRCGQSIGERRPALQGPLRTCSKFDLGDFIGQTANFSRQMFLMCRARRLLQ